MHVKQRLCHNKQCVGEVFNIGNDREITIANLAHLVRERTQSSSEIVYIPSATSRGLSMHLWKIEQVSHAIANGYWVGTINRVGTEPLGDNDFYGTSYFANPRGEIVAEASDAEEEVLVADLDLEQNRAVRNQWQFYRDRRPDQYGPIMED